MKRFAAVLLGLAGLFLLSADEAGAEPAAHEAEFVARVNALRATKGLGPLAVDNQLTSVARAWSAKMAQDGALSHNPNLPNQVSNWRLVGENVGVGPTVAVIEQAFENSPAHYANLVKGEYQFIGVGVVEVGSTIWVTQNFKQAKTVAPAVAAPAVPVPRPAPAPGPRRHPGPPPPRVRPHPGPRLHRRPQRRPRPRLRPPPFAPAPATPEVAGVTAKAPEEDAATPLSAEPASSSQGVMLPSTALVLLAAAVLLVVRHRRRYA